MMMPSFFGEKFFDVFFDDFEIEFFGRKNPLYGKHSKNMMKTDIRETDNSYELDIDLPGFKKEDIDVTLENRYLTISTSKGIDKDDIYRKVYNTYSESRLRLMGYVLSNMTVYSESNSALITLTKAEQSKFNYIKGDSEGFVNIPLSIKNVCFSCFLREDTEKPMIKISLRSVGTFPCNQLAAEFFHGGGHLNASGGEFFGTMEEAKAVFEKALEKYKPLLTAKS